MPLYEYKCVKCGHRFEKIESHSASVTKKCPKCGANAKRMFAAPAIQFKGSGWYVTDYAPKSSGSSSSSEKSGDGAPAKPAETPATSSKTESTPAKKKK